MKDSLASAYTLMLTDDEFRDKVAGDASVLDTYEDLDADDKSALQEEASAEVSGFAIGRGAVMTRLGGGPPLSPDIASGLGMALNSMAGLPSGALEGPGFVSNAACCPWGPAFIP